MLINLPFLSRYLNYPNKNHNVATQQEVREEKKINLLTKYMERKKFFMSYNPLVKCVVAMVIKIMQRWNNQTRIFKINCENVTLPYPKKSLFTIILYNNWSIECI